MNRKIQQMLDEIENEYRITGSMTGKTELDRRVKSAILQTPRDRFVPEKYVDIAFDNAPLPVGFGQTISQPYIVALMTDLLEAEAEHRILEIGTGSGYQAAVLSQLCSRVYTIEYISTLAAMAQNRLAKLGYRNIECRTGNGYYGWPEQAPFDGIIVTAAATSIPAPLVEQLKPGGRMVIPIGRPYFHQELTLLEKSEDGKVKTSDILGVAFVPFQGQED